MKGRTLTGDPLCHTEHQGMGSVPSQSSQNNRKENQKSYLESAQNNNKEKNGLIHGLCTFVAYLMQKPRIFTSLCNSQPSRPCYPKLDHSTDLETPGSVDNLQVPHNLAKHHLHPQHLENGREQRGTCLPEGKWALLALSHYP